MYKVTAICDKCKAENTEERSTEYARCHIPKGWQTVKMTISQYEKKDYLLCSECREELGLVKPEKPNEEVKIETVEERLFNVIAEIVQMQQG